MITDINCLESTFVKLNTVIIQTTGGSVLCYTKKNYHGIFQLANTFQLTLIIIFAVSVNLHRYVTS